jgi:hydroxymethylglutaryl-CoA reductase (NADPH)
MKPLSFTQVPTSIVGPIHFKSMQGTQQKHDAVEVSAPLATYETTLFHSVGRGARLTRLSKTLTTTVISNKMTRSLLFEASFSYELLEVKAYIENNLNIFQEKIVSKNSRYATLTQADVKIVGNLLYVRFAFTTGDASGHNMTTFAADAIADDILATFTFLKYVSVSGNYCTDKKVSAVNSVLGRGKEVIAEMLISRALVKDVLRTTPEALVDLNIKKNLIGSIASGGLMSANAHYANMLLAFYIATGQDGANIVEGSQGITHAEVKGDNLYFSVTLPNIIVGTIGHGKHSEDAVKQLELMDCTGENSAEKLAQIAAALVLCGELSLMAALTNPKELTQSHTRIERK